MRQILIPIGSTLKSQLYITMGRLLVDLKRILLFNKKSQPRIIIEVGSHRGDNNLLRECSWNNDRLYMFEPSPLGYKQLVNKITKFKQGNMIAINKAVSDFNGQAKFHISNYDACSSLNKFNKRVNDVLEDNLGKEGFHMIDKVTVDVIRLDKFITDNKIGHIDFLIIDAQGEDFKIVKSLGKYIKLCQKIQVEVCINKDPLYENQFSKQDIIKYMQKHGFKIEKSRTQSFNREENIIFRKKGGHH